MTKTIETTAQKYQAIDREIKALNAKLKPLKTQLLKYAEENKTDFDDAFQLKFGCGTYITLRVADCLEGDKEAKVNLLAETGDEYAKIDIDEKAVVLDATQDNKLRKLLTKLGLKIAQKETLAIYAG